MPRLDPSLVQAYFGRGATFLAQNCFDEALVAFDQVLDIDPKLVPAHLNRGAALRALGRARESLSCYERVLELAPDDVVALDGRAIALCDLGRFEEGLASVERALAAVPDFAPAQVHAALIRLRLGDFERGLSLYEARWRGGVRGLADRDLGRPRWDGRSNLCGRSILVHAEQGLGDTVQFLRYVPLLAARGARVVLEVPGTLAEFVRTLEGAPEIVVRGEPLRETDFECPLLSLPYAMNTTLRSIPAAVPYLTVDPEAVMRRRNDLARGVDRIIGIAWRGSVDFASDSLRSIAFNRFVRILDVPGTRFVSLQKEMHDDERMLARGLELVHPGESFLGTAEIVAAVDLVVSTCSVWAHVAGALARPVWVLLHSSPHWTWLVGRDDSPWYPTARLFRQQRPGDWSGVLEDAHGALATWR
jgi:hypothetical protein